MRQSLKNPSSERNAKCATKSVNRIVLAGLIGLSMNLPTLADDPPSPANCGAAKNPIPIDTTEPKPVWLTDLSLGVKESYDTNVFLSGVDQSFLPSNTATLKDRSSWVTTISPKIGLNFAPLLHQGDLLQVAAFGYAPDFVIFHDQPSETYYAHRFTNIIKGKTEALSYNLENAFSYIDGSTFGPIYPDALLNAYSTATVRERRDQFQDRAKISVQYDLDNWFVRPTGSLLYYDLLTHLIDAPGYQNYIDRYDINGGVDLGYKVTSKLALTLGYRYGYQYQQQLPWNQTNATNDYRRVLFGMEGRPFKWLKLEAMAGPEFKDYNANTPLADKHPVKVYAEAGATADISHSDILVLKYKRFEWVSCLGVNPYVDSLYDLSYRHKLASKLTLEAGARAADSNYTPACARDDWEFTVSAGLRYAWTTNLGIDVSYAVDWGRNNEDGIVNPQNREFERQVVSIGTQWRF